MTPDTPEQAAVRDALELLCFRAGHAPGDDSPIAACRVYLQLVAEGVRLAAEQDAACPADCAVAQWLRRECGLSPGGWPRLLVGETAAVLVYRRPAGELRPRAAKHTLRVRTVPHPAAVMGAMQIVREKRKVA